jgi:hypothetical protein
MTNPTPQTTPTSHEIMMAFVSLHIIASTSNVSVASLTHHWPMPLSWMPIILPTWGLPLFQKLSTLLGRPIRVCFDYAYSGAVGLINKGV